MARRAFRGLAFLAAAALTAGAAGGQPAASDKVVVRDRKDGSVKTLEGKLKLGPGGLQVVASNNKVVTTVPAEDLVRFTPADLPGIDRNAVLTLVSVEEEKPKADYRKALVGYTDLQKKVVGAAEPSRRYVDFKVAQMATKVADESGDDEKWDELAAVAERAWGGFLNDYQGVWEVWPATRARARLLVELKKYDEVARLWARAAKTPDLPADLKLECELEALDAEIRSGGFAAAASAAEALTKSAGPGAAKDKLALYEIAAKAAVKASQAGGGKAEIEEGVKAIEAAVAKTKDPAVRAVGHGMMGELYRTAGELREAMYEFLWVETVYSQDKDEVLKALCRLTDLFRVQGDEDRAKACREKIRRLRESF